MGALICGQRKEKNMTQKELADKLQVTDKAVSKWERGLSYPDVSLIVSLAEILGVTTTELLKGEKDEENGDKEDEHARQAVLETISYAQKTFGKSLRTKERIIIGILSLLCLIAVFVCALCNVVIDHTFSWSLIVAGGVVLGWAVVVPVIKHKGKGIWLGLAAVSLLIIPYLFLIEQQGPVKGWFMPLGLPIAVISLAFLWAYYFIFRMKKLSIWNKIATLCLMAGAMTLITNFLAKNYCSQPWLTVDVIINVLVEILFAMVLVILGLMTKNKEMKIKKVEDENQIEEIASEDNKEETVKEV